MSASDYVPNGTISSDSHVDRDSIPLPNHRPMDSLAITPLTEIEASVAQQMGILTVRVIEISAQRPQDLLIPSRLDLDAIEAFTN